jgi:hypothetical protein
VVKNLFVSGVLLSKSTKQKLSKKRFLEAVHVGASNYVSLTVWTTMFMEAQGHVVTQCVLELDNKSVVKINMNGRSLADHKDKVEKFKVFLVPGRNQRK